ncbi:TBC1 domain family member protein [Canna indica]|uniref:TBC1 domain family member protein n=1 Tax=Canna indica TaxID=4628 RepID=A0AAQ3KGG2_9LILI|nr:TBC1 domain family member protein [Canna indica]
MGSAPVEASASEVLPQKRFSNLRSVRWRIDLGILPSSPSASIDDLRRVTADTRRRYASLRRRLLIDHHAPKDGDASPDLTMDNPLSQNPDSTWGRFFSYAELAKMVDQDLCRLYPEHSSYFHTPKCQAMLRRLLSLWCLQHPDYGYRQGMHELLAPLVYVLHVDLDHLFQVQKLYDDFFSDEFDETSSPENELFSSNRIRSVRNWDSGIEIDNDLHKMNDEHRLDELDPDTREIFLLSDPYGAEGELGIILSERFMEHDAYCMFDNLMDGAQGVVAMASFFSPVVGSSTNLPPVIEASSALYHLLSIVDSSLHSHLVELGVEPQYFALRWLRVLFGREFCLDDLLVIWDELFSSSNTRCIDDDMDYSFQVLCSPRGAFIAALAVSMLLYLRSSLLATETATSCLQRLLNFPQSPDMKKLIEKAKSLQVLALESNISSSSSHAYSNNSKLMITRVNSPQPSSTLAKAPVNIRPDSYWEEKWRVLHKDEEIKKQSNNVSSATGMMRKILTSKLNLSRTKSEPFEGQNARPQPSVRRRLFDDMCKDIEGEKDQDISECYEAPVTSNNLNVGKDLPEGLSTQSSRSCVIEETLSSGDNSLDFSTSTSPHEIGNDHENESVKSSVTSNSFVGENDEETISMEEPYSQNNQNEETNNMEEPCCQTNQNETNNMEEPCNQNVDHQLAPSAEVASSVTVNAVQEEMAPPKDRKLFAGKFQWFWKFGRGSNEVNQQSQQNAGCTKKDNIDISSSDGMHNSSGVNRRTEVGDKKVLDSIRNLGQSMLENIQVIETVFQQDKGKFDSLDNLSSNILGSKGQVTAVAALKELRKISNLLQEM